MAEYRESASAILLIIPRRALDLLGKLSSKRYIEITDMEINELQINDEERSFNIRG